MTQLYAPAFDPGAVTAWDEHNITSGDPREWGVDVGLRAGTVIDAPFAGTLTYQPSSVDWAPGRLLLTGGPGGETLGLGHVASNLQPGESMRVTAGQPLGAIQADTPGGPHVELMLFQTSNLSHAGASDPRAYVAALEGVGAPPSAAQPGAPNALLTGWGSGGAGAVGSAIAGGAQSAGSAIAGVAGALNPLNWAGDLAGALASVFVLPIKYVADGIHNLVLGKLAPWFIAHLIPVVVGVIIWRIMVSGQSSGSSSSAPSPTPAPAPSSSPPPEAEAAAA